MDWSEMLVPANKAGPIWPKSSSLFLLTSPGHNSNNYHSSINKITSTSFLSTSQLFLLGLRFPPPHLLCLMHFSSIHMDFCCLPFFYRQVFQLPSCSLIFTVFLDSLYLLFELFLVCGSVHFEAIFLHLSLSLFELMVLGDKPFMNWNVLSQVF